MCRGIDCTATIRIILATMEAQAPGTYERALKLQEIKASHLQMSKRSPSPGTKGQIKKPRGSEEQEDVLSNPGEWKGMCAAYRTCSTDTPHRATFRKVCEVLQQRHIRPMMKVMQHSDESLLGGCLPIDPSLAIELDIALVIPQEQFQNLTTNREPRPRFDSSIEDLMGMPYHHPNKDEAVQMLARANMTVHFVHPIRVHIDRFMRTLNVQTPILKDEYKFSKALVCLGFLLAECLICNYSHNHYTSLSSDKLQRLILQSTSECIVSLKALDDGSDKLKDYYSGQYGFRETPNHDCGSNWMQMSLHDALTRCSSDIATLSV